MPSPTDKGYFLEINERFLLAARTISLNRPLVIEDLGEAPLDNKAGLSQVLSTVIPDTSKGTVDAICALRPQQQFIHLATDDEARQHATPAALPSFVSQSPFAALGASDVVGVQIRTGLPLDGRSGGRWLLTGAPKESLAAIQAMAREWKLAPVRVESATLSLLGAVLSEQQFSKSATPLVVWEVGDATSDLFLLSGKGLEGAKHLDFGFDKVVEGVQAEMNLKFKGAAARLLFNEFYDFSEVGPKIAARVTAVLQPAVTELVAGSAPASLLCIGMTSKQAWFNDYMAKSLGLAPWQPNLAAWFGSVGLKFAGNTVSAGLSPVWLGLLGAVSTYRGEKPDADSAWHPTWDGVVRSAAPAASRVERPAAPVAAAAVARAAAPVAPAPAKPAPVVKTVPPTPVVPRPAAAPVAAVKAARPPETPVFIPEKKVPAPAAVIPRPAAVETQPKRPITPTPVTPAKPSLAVRPPTGSTGGKPSFLKSPVGLAAILGVLIVLGGGYYFYQSNADAKAAALHAQVVAEQRAAESAKAEAEARRLAKQAEEARRAAEAEVARKNAASEAATRQAQEESRRRDQETNRLLNGRGNLVIATEPAGAAINIANLAPRIAPATISDLRLGHYTVNISLAGYDPVSLDLEVKDNANTDPGVVRLVRQVGGLELVTDPAGIKYEIRPAASRFFATGSGVRQGTTPATIKDLTTGDYIVVLTREGWPNHEENFTIARGDTARVSWKALGGSVQITTNPAGATVSRNGIALGVTPLTLEDVPPGDVRYSVELQDYTAAVLRGTVEPERRLALEMELEATAEHIARLNELDTRPEAIKRVQPSLTYRMEQAGGNVTISCVVDAQGMPTMLRIDKQTDVELGKRCLEAASQWRFKPGMIKGKPVKTRVTLPFIITPTAT